MKRTIVSNGKTDLIIKKRESYKDAVNKCIPGEAFTIEELWGRAMRGEDISLMKKYGIYEDDPNYDSDMVILRKPDLDLTDIQAISNRLKRTMEIIEANEKVKKQELSTPPTPPEPEGEGEEV